MAGKIHPKKFTIGHGPTVLAVQVTAENHADIASWTKSPHALAISNQPGGEGEETNQRVRVRTPFGHRTAEIGDWVYKNLDDNEIYVAKSATVEETFVPVKPVRKSKEKE